MKAYEITDGIQNGQGENVLSVLYEGLEDAFFEEGVDSFNRCEIAVFTAATFMGQMRNGGLGQALADPWVQIAHHVINAFRRVGADAYGGVLKKMFEQIGVVDSMTADEIGALVDEIDADELDAIEQPFWDIFFNNENEKARFDNLIISFIRVNANEFAE